MKYLSFVVKISGRRFLCHLCSVYIIPKLYTLRKNSLLDGVSALIPLKPLVPFLSLVG
jgi:hypothetical protein